MLLKDKMIAPTISLSNNELPRKRVIKMVKFIVL